jgi:predicted ester cyclase
LALATPDIELPAPRGLTFRGLDGFRQWFRMWMETAPDRQVRVRNVVTAQNQLIYEGTFTGMQTGVLYLPTGDIPPTARRINADYVGVLRVSGGKISYLHHYFDVMELMTQLGLVASGAKV